MCIRDRYQRRVHGDNKNQVNHQQQSDRHASMKQATLLSIALIFWAASLIAYAEDPITLPDWPPLNYKLYAGQLVLEKNDTGFPIRSMFYLQHDSQRNPQQDPIVFWISGGVSGPGCSSLISMLRGLTGVSQPEGSDTFTDTQQGALNTNATIVFLEAPSGVGFSFRHVNSTAKYDFYWSVWELTEAILEYFEKFPQYKNNDIYIAGEGWTGVVVPRVIEKLDEEKAKEGPGKDLKIKGGIIGNGEMDSNPYHREKARWDFLWGHQLYNIETRQIVVDVCHNNPNAPRCIFAQESINRLSKGVNPFDVRGDCHVYNPKDPGGFRQDGWIPCVNYSNIYEYFQRADVKVTFLQDQGIWLPCNNEIFTSYETPQSAVKNLKDVLEKGYRILYYAGDLDSTYPFNEAFRWIPHLNLPVENKWREWKPFGRVAGHVINYSRGFTFATVRGAGMGTYIRKRRETNHLLGAFLAGKNPDELQTSLSRSIIIHYKIGHPCEYKRKKLICMSEYNHITLPTLFLLPLIADFCSSLMRCWS
eukprot:TRINITY_DN527_c0_g2_i2.p1 TRINITY_DN527_c0_g2~~TRINITY_DN527_c0_g2_i2.p1  ORF type:complete len:560 (+),score=154.24 TRINITY_DN527_c0_g2_i2:87-1682(+)